MKVEECQWIGTRENGGVIDETDGTRDAFIDVPRGSSGRARPGWPSPTRGQ